MRYSLCKQRKSGWEQRVSIHESPLGLLQQMAKDMEAEENWPSVEGHFDYTIKTLAPKPVHPVCTLCGQNIEEDADAKH